jgi:hypothetical protein
LIDDTSFLHTLAGNYGLQSTSVNRHGKRTISSTFSFPDRSIGNVQIIAMGTRFANYKSQWRA